MKKKYILTLEFEAEIKEKVSPKMGRCPLRKKERYFNKLFEVLLKSDQTILEIYRNLLMSDLGDGNNVYDIDTDIPMLHVTDDIDVLMPVIETLPADEKSYFIKIVAGEDKKSDDFLEDLYDRLGGLKLTDAKFTEKNI